MTVWQENGVSYALALLAVNQTLQGEHFLKVLANCIHDLKNCQLLFAWKTNFSWVKVAKMEYFL